MIFGNSLRHIAFKTSNRIHSKRKKVHKKESYTLDIKRLDNDSILYQDDNAINLCVKYFNQQIEVGNIKRVRATARYIILADFKNSLIWKIERVGNYIKGIRRY